MIVVKQIEGTDKMLYSLVSHLVMDPEVLRQNNNYPFKTSLHFVWFIALEGDRVVGFLPVERRNANKAVINNYYILNESSRILEAMVHEAVQTMCREFLLEAVSQTRDTEIFARYGFCPGKVWKNYVKMTIHANPKRI